IPHAYSRSSYYACFDLEDYKPSPKLTLNVRVRWDLFTTIVHRYNHKSRVIPTKTNPDLTPNPLLGVFETATPSNPSGMNTYYRDFSPRIGLAYSLDRKSTRLNSSHGSISYAVFCLKKKMQLISYTTYIQKTNAFTLAFSNSQRLRRTRMSTRKFISFRHDITISACNFYCTLSFA